tara:strand:- start:129 stop:587 length:459 start_codon:yes stop_codon:yes gene_type:complete
MPVKKLPEFNFRIPVRYDFAFRSRVENERLRKAHPKVKKIHVKPRNQVNNSGHINIIIAAPTKKIAESCFLDGNKTIKRRITNNKRTLKNTSLKKKTLKKQTLKKNEKKKKSPKNNRPLVQYPEDVTSSTDWADYESRKIKYQRDHPEWKIL